jgi:hypothetical protein
MHIVLLGPQRRPTVDNLVRSLQLPPDAPLATVTAGWREREGDDGELNALLGGRGVNLSLHARWLDANERDPEYAVAELNHQLVLGELQSLYLVSLDAALRAVYALAEHPGRPRARQAALEDAEAAVRLLDDRHLTRVREANAEFYAAWRPWEREAIAGHRDAIHGILARCTGLVLAGGHVNVLLRTLHVFHLAPAVPQLVIAWSAGAMALTERVVLFHDFVLEGSGGVEVYEEGIGLLAGLVLLPHARRRLRVDDPLRMGVLARRFAPARCVVLDDGIRADVDNGTLRGDARIIGTDGKITALAA